MMITNAQLREMAAIAQQNWLLDEDTDPEGNVRKGLEFLASEGDYDQEIIDERLGENANFDSEAAEKWDRLEEWAKYLGSPVR